MRGDVVPRDGMRSDKYVCPVCGGRYGELMNTKRLANHLETEGDGYTLCRGSRTVISALVPGGSGGAAAGRGRAPGRGRVARPDPRIGPGQEPLFGLEEAFGQPDEE